VVDWPPNHSTNIVFERVFSGWCIARPISEAKRHFDGLFQSKVEPLQMCVWWYIHGLQFEMVGLLLLN
jgi:hypothetical protein